MINILIPMAGMGSRFKKAGYNEPKPFIDVGGMPMISRVLKNLDIPGATYLLIGRACHLNAEPTLIKKLSADYNIKWISVDQNTEGTVCTALFARSLINNEHPLIIANCDQLIDGGIMELLEDARDRDLDGAILSFQEKSRDPKWSYAKLGPDGLVAEVREKKPISDLATVGVYYFKRGADFVDAAIEMIIRNDRVNNEFYTCPVYNVLISRALRIGATIISGERMHGLGTPSDLTRYLEFLVHQTSCR